MTKDKGVTLVALVVTIIVLLILASVTINMVAGQNGILKKANDAKKATIVAQEKEGIDAVLVATKLGEGENTIRELTQEGLQERLDIQFGKNKSVVSEKQADGEFIITILNSHNRYRIKDKYGAEKIED